MERSRDLRRQTVSSVNGLPRRRQRICTLRDSTDQDRRMELQETVRLGGDRREFLKRRKIDRSAVQQKSDGGVRYRENSTDSSDEEYYEMEEDMSIHRTNQLSPPSSSLPINRRGLRTLRSSPVLGAGIDEMLGVPIPRRARSSSAKRLDEYCNSGSGGLGEELNRRRSSPAPLGLIGSGDSTKKKMRSVERRTTPISNPPELSVVQDDIEIEVVEALFDLMKQSQSRSQSHSSQRQVERDNAIPASDELKTSKADGGKVENNAFSVQDEPSIKARAEIVLADSTNDVKEEGTVEKERFSDDSVQDLASGDYGFVRKVIVGSPKESESLSCVKVNACDIQHPTMTKAHYDAIIVEAEKETKPEIDLMASPLLSSPEREGLIDMRTDTGAMAQAVRKRSEIISKDGPVAVAFGMQGVKNGVIDSNQLSSLDVEKHNHDAAHQGLKEHKNQSRTFLLPFPDGMSGWPGVPHLGLMPPLPAVLPVNGSAKSSMMMQPPQFKLSPSRPKKCATHQYLAQSMHCHQQLIKKSLSSGSSGPALDLTNSPSLKYMYPAQNLIQGGRNLAMVSVGSGKDKSPDAAVAFNATTSSKPLLQQASHPASASSFLAPMMAPANSSGSPQSASLLSNSAGRFPANLTLPNASTTMSLNLPMFSSNEAASYMAMLHTNIALPSFRGPPSTAFNPSLYPYSPFYDTQSQQQLTTNHASVQSASQNTNLLSQTVAKISENKYPTSATANSKPEKPFQPSQLSSKSDTETNWKNGASLASGPVSHSVKPSNLETRSASAQPRNFAMIPPVSVGGGGGCNKPMDPPQKGSKGTAELIPQAFALSFGSNSSATPMLSFSSMAQTSAMFQMLPDMSRIGNQMTLHKNFQASEGKYLATGGQSLNRSKSDCSEISALSTVEPLKFDGFARNINFLPSDSQPFQTSAAALSSGYQQHQLIQIQDFHMHHGGTGQVKSSNPPGSFFTGILPSSSQVSAPKDTLSFHPKWENFPRSEGSPQLKTSQGQSHINFLNGPTSATSFQGQKSMPPLKVESSSSSSMSRSSQRNASTVGLSASTTTTSVLPSQEAEAQVGAAQKSSPACRRNVPSILSTCPPELKYSEFFSEKEGCSGYAEIWR